ncbi:MAG: hypothetical protein UW37_C0040G0009 [Candidatus Gottesmanbacteria bacterium GW2011_GWA2_44_17]|uniref:Uncharacterized protein n=1 Tax=Candidatus Gottesmanbacteria bacterium GW2011_GWA2_44_17 TaxID=1618444 RepID=A0A0G1HG09_9BACT|nr:MAG: hypothetical protein UW37_C0040G0009 [Candidatus Gottesmanbacteria bacterium GW2011_GWA2_44_17]
MLLRLQLTPHKTPPEESFADDYEDYENRHPEPMDEEEVEKKIKETKEQQSESARQAAGYETEKTTRIPLEFLFQKNINKCSLN